MSGPGKQTHDEWTSRSIMIRRLIVRKPGPSLMLIPFRQLRARMLRMLTVTAQFPLIILRVVATAMTFTQPRAAAHWRYWHLGLRAPH